MHYAFSTNAYTKFSLAQALKQIHLHGYDGVEILADMPHAFPYKLLSKEIIAVKRFLKQTGLSISNINANTALGFHSFSLPDGEVIFEPSLCNKKAEVRMKRINYTKRCIDLAVEWEAKSISITSGRPLAGNCPEQAYQYFLLSLEEILEYAERKGILVGIEYEPGQLIERADEVERVLTDLSCPYLGVNLDIGHAEVIGESLPETINRFSGRIWNIHLEDIKAHKHYHLVPGEGDINFQKVFKALNDIGYDRFITLELYTYPDIPDDVARRSLNYLKSINLKGDE